MMPLIHYVAGLLSPGQVGVPDNGDIGQAQLDGILNAVYFVAGFVAVVVIIIGSINYVTSSGDSNKATKAKDTILYAAIGLVVVMSAFVITNYVIGKVS